MPSVPAAPSSREMDVLTLVAQGMTNAQVAARLSLSTRTVDHHVANLLAKTVPPGERNCAVWSPGGNSLSPPVTRGAFRET